MTRTQRHDIRWLIIVIVCFALHWWLSLRADAGSALRLTVSQDRMAVTLAWDPSVQPVLGYRVSFSTTRGIYNLGDLDVGRLTQTTVNLPTSTDTTQYFFLVRAYDATGLSDSSNEVATPAVAPLPPPGPAGAPTLRTVTVTTDPIGGTSTATLTWDPSATTVSGYKIFAGQGSRVYSALTDVGLATTGTITVATPALPTPFYFAVTSYLVGQPDSGFSNELTAVIPAGAPPTPPPPPPPPPPMTDECAAPFGKFIVTATITRYVKTTGAAGSLSRLEYLVTTSPNSPLTRVAVLLNGAVVRTGEGLDVTAFSGLWFTLPTAPGSYTVALEARNAAGCTAVQTRDASGRAIVVVVK